MTVRPSIKFTLDHWYELVQLARARGFTHQQVHRLATLKQLWMAGVVTEYPT